MGSIGRFIVPTKNRPRLHDHLEHLVCQAPTQSSVIPEGWYPRRVHTTHCLYCKVTQEKLRYIPSLNGRCREQINVPHAIPPSHIHCRITRSTQRMTLIFVPPIPPRMCGC